VVEEGGVSPTPGSEYTIVLCGAGVVWRSSSVVEEGGVSPTPGSECTIVLCGAGVVWRSSSVGEEGGVSPSPGSVTSMTTARMDPTRKPAVSSSFFHYSQNVTFLFLYLLEYKSLISY
jgi:hypothetical protein